MTTLGFAALAYLAGVQLHVRGAEPWSSRLDFDRAGARAAGCALALAEVGATARAVLGTRLEAMTSPRDSTNAWLAAFTTGAEACTYLPRHARSAAARRRRRRHG